jgi:hypothetical protein
MPETLELLEGGGGGTELLELLLGAELELGATDELLGEDTTAELLLTATLDEETSAELLIAATFELLERAELPGAMLEELGSSPPPPPPDEQERVNAMANPRVANLLFVMLLWCIMV